VLAIADLNGDFRPDALVANNCSTRGKCSTGIVGVLLARVGFQTYTNMQSSLNPPKYGQKVMFGATLSS